MILCKKCIMGLLTFLVLIVLSPKLYAFEHLVTTVDRCVGDLTIQTEYAQSISPSVNYTFLNCYEDNHNYICHCTNPTPIIINLTGNTDDVFDFVIWYYTDDIAGKTTIELDNIRRKVPVSNIIFAEVKEVKEFPKGGIIVLGVAIIVAIVFCSIIIYQLVRWLKRDDSDTIGDKELEDYMRRLLK